MTEFQEGYMQCQKNLIRINNKWSFFNKLIWSFDAKVDLQFILEQLDSYDYTKHYIEYNNFATFIIDEKIKKDIGQEWETLVIDKIKWFFNKPDFISDSHIYVLRDTIDILFFYGNDIEYILKLYDKIIVAGKELDQMFEDYFIKNNVKDWFKKAFERWIETSQNTFMAYFLYETSLKYILDNDLLERFIDLSSNTDDLTIKFFSEITKRSYSDIEPVDNVLKDMIMIKIKSLETWHPVLKKLYLLLQKLVSAYAGLGNVSHYRDELALQTPFAFELADYLIKQWYSFFREIITLIKENPIRPPNSIINFLAHIIQKDDIQWFCETDLDTMNSLKIWLYDAIELDSKGDVGTEFRKYLSKELDERNKRAKEYNDLQRKQKEEREIKFKEDVALAKKNAQEKSFISDWLIYHYVNQKESFSSEDAKFIEVQVRQFFDDTESYVPSKWELHRDKENPNSYTAPAYIVRGTFYNCLLLAKEFDFSLDQYVNKIIEYLPFAYDDWRKFVFDNISSIWQQDVDYLLGVYGRERDKKDDLRLHNPVNFILTYKTYKKDFLEYDKEKKAITILYELLEDTRDLRIASEVLDALWEDLDDSAFFTKFFNDNIVSWINYFNDILWYSWKYTEEQIKRYKLALRANEILIGKFNDDDAIKWRLDQLLQSNVVIQERLLWVVSSLSNLESEVIFHQDFTKVLKNISDSKYESFFIKLLEHSFELKKQNKEDANFFSYLWEPVGSYLKKNTNKSFLEDIVSLCEKYPDEGYFFRSNYLNKW